MLELEKEKQRLEKKNKPPPPPAPPSLTSIRDDQALQPAESTTSLLDGIKGKGLRHVVMLLIFILFLFFYELLCLISKTNSLMLAGTKGEAQARRRG